MGRKPKLPDGKLPDGLWLRGRTYYARFWHNGVLVRKRLSTVQESAKRKLTKLKARLDEGDFGLLDRDYPWQELKEEFLRHARQTLRRPREVEADLNRIEAFLKLDKVK